MDGGERSEVWPNGRSVDPPACYGRRVSPPPPSRQQTRRCRETIRLTPAPAARALGQTGYKYPVNEGAVDVGGLRLHYVEWGERTRPHVLLVHGWDGTAHYWDLVAPALADRYHLVALTLRGRGQSDADPTGRYRFAEYGRDIHEAMRRLGLDRLSFVGASLGGMIALPYVAEHEAQVDRLVLVDIGAQPGGQRPRGPHPPRLAPP